MANALTIAHMETRIADYHLVVEKWLSGSIDDHHLKQCGDYLLFYDAAGVEQAAHIRERSQSSEAWKQLCDEWIDACDLHAKLSDISRLIARIHHLGGDSASNLRRMYFGFISNMNLEQIETFYEELNLPRP